MDTIVRPVNDTICLLLLLLRGSLVNRLLQSSATTLLFLALAPTATVFASRRVRSLLFHALVVVRVGARRFRHGHFERVRCAVAVAVGKICNFFLPLTRLAVAVRVGACEARSDSVGDGRAREDWAVSNGPFLCIPFFPGTAAAL